MMLDVENKDTERVAAAVGSTGVSVPSGSQKVSTTLVTNTHTSKREKKKKRSPAKSDSTRSVKYHSEGPCPHHGAKCGHAGSECYVLHPELKPMGTSEGSNIEDSSSSEDSSRSTRSVKVKRKTPAPTLKGAEKPAVVLSSAASADDGM